jgi:hypothetical protein
MSAIKDIFEVYLIKDMYLNQDISYNVLYEGHPLAKP